MWCATGNDPWPSFDLVYINDLPNCLSLSIPIMYADDTHITYAGSDLNLIQSSLSHDLEKLSKWLMSNRLTLNATKTEFMLIGFRKRLSTLSDTLELSIDNFPIQQVSSVKSLGIYINENLMGIPTLINCVKRSLLQSEP